MMFDITTQPVTPRNRTLLLDAVAIAGLVLVAGSGKPGEDAASNPAQAAAASPQVAAAPAETLPASMAAPEPTLPPEASAAVPVTMEDTPAAAVVEMPVESPVAEAPAVAVNGGEVYAMACALCHNTGLNAAPKHGSKPIWAARIAQGKDVLYQSSLNGKRNMPPKGGRPDLSDEQVKAAVDFMVNAAGGWPAGS